MGYGISGLYISLWLEQNSPLLWHVWLIWQVWHIMVCVTQFQKYDFLLCHTLWHVWQYMTFKTHTVLFLWDWTRVILCSKWPHFNLVWWILCMVLCPILSLLSITATLGFTKRYVTLYWLNILRNSSWSKLKVWQKP